MANLLSYKDKQFKVGDTLSIHYKIKEGDKERIQIFKGILLKIKGDTPETRMFTVRKITKSGDGVERIIALSSPYIQDIVSLKKTSYKRSKAYFIRGLTEQEIRTKLYHTKKTK
ncbi:MAG: 50S ribosomal protein L19 [Candidatus Roizmanbacteria bacterium GW2011_GWC1_37_12]|nr:MAG: 50S ribosomal protein L19 [Candidatus Roizmanbacteria bacterium GW2011_GWC1_37_12]